ncbi:restriction endonuclease subunit S [Hymenobacter gummosus]|uniref:Restriction endonuclease subunit S n=1 Tax=Hymenobacter gummosus TaxID=1776032 RepID=A0A3S0HR57_9BACT|nr:restriction endonuclease subunit S [Hymenobacter gummosus]RTQ53270.1 restriction endonuclease subunit S [Hymenobacter gummosus]
MKWEIRELGQVADTTSGGTPTRTKSEYWGGDIPWLKSGELRDCYIDSNEEFITASGLKNSSAKLFAPGTLLLALYGATAGKLGILGFPASTNQAVCGITPKADVMHTKFLYYFLLSKREQIIKDSFGGAQPNISQGYVRKLRVPVPPVHVQQQIADTLDKADALRRKDQEILQKYDQLAQSIFYDMFGDPSTNEKGWVFKDVELLLSQEKDGTKCGPFGSALKKEDYQSSGVPVWVMDNIKNSTFDETGCLFISEEKFAQLRSYCIDPGDIIISRAGTVGKMCVVDTAFPHSIISTNLIRLSLNKSMIEPEYFVLLFKYFGNKIGRLRKGADGAFTHMNTSVLCSLTIPVPPLELQTAFLHVLDRVKASKDLVTKNRTNALFTSLLQQYLA